MITGYTAQLVGSHTSLATLSTAIALAPPAGGDVIQLQVFAQNIRYTLDGTTPTATTGFQITSGSCVVIDVGSDHVLKVIEETASASVQYQWFRAKRDNDV